jgi:beta-glucosidase-like glycosyl hydrolase
MDFHQFLIPRLEGNEIESNFDYYRKLVQKGIGGFIVFGGELDTLREGIMRLQSEAALPLIISSDLEQGLGQQVRGGTLFPPAMGMAEAAQKDPVAVREAFMQMAREAAYAGINVIFAPVLDINVNPDNPIISTRAFGEDAGRVSPLGVEMIRAIQAEGVMACGKHFPGHGATDIDSHISLPVINKTIEELEALELLPFREAVGAGVDMLMTGHLSVPALDPSGAPMTVSPPAMEYIRGKLGFRGMIITDAMNMGGIVEQSQSPSYLALKAGVDIVLHPDEPERVARELAESDLQLSDERLTAFRRRLIPAPKETRQEFDTNLARRLTELSLKVEGQPRPVHNPFVITVSDEARHKGEEFCEAIGANGSRNITPESSCRPPVIPEGADVVVAVFSEPKAWKGGTVKWIRKRVRELTGTAETFVAFGNPYTVGELGEEHIRAYAFWTAPEAQRAMAERLRKNQ